MRKALALTAAVVLSGCATFGGSAENYHAEGYWLLDSVQRPATTADRWGDYEIVEADEGVQYRDDLVEVLVIADLGQFEMQVTNLSEHSVRILWEGASYVGPSGLASRVVEGQTRMIELNRVSPPITIPSGAATQVTAVPVNNVHRNDLGETELLPFVQGVESCAQLDGATLRLVLPLEVQGEPNEYTFRFEPGEMAIVGTRAQLGMSERMREVSREPC